MTQRSRVRLAGAVLVTLVTLVVAALVVVGRTGDDSGSDPPDRPAVAVPGVPATFAGTAAWQVSVTGAEGVDAAEPGIAVVRRRNDHGYTVAVLDAASGRTDWSSRPVPAAQPPRVRFTSDEGRPWVLVSASDGAATTVWVFDAYARGTSVRPVREHTFTGETAAPVVTVAERGVLVTGVKGVPGHLYRSASGVAQVFAVPGQVPLRSYGTSVLVTGAGGFGLTAEGGGWRSRDRVPPGAAPGEPRVVGVAEPLVAALWPATDGGRLLALHDVLTGRVRATHRMPDDPPADAAFTVARDAQWATYGTLALRLGEPAVDTLPGGPYAFTQVHDGVAYGTGPGPGASPPASAPPQSPGPASASPSGRASVSPSGRASASARPSATPPGSASPSGGVPSTPATAAAPVALDLVTGQPLDGPAPTLVPVDFDGFGHGLFVLVAPGERNATLYAVPLKRWRP